MAPQDPSQQAIEHPPSPERPPPVRPPRALRPALLRPFRHRDFRLMWAGLAVSMVGNGIYTLAVAWQVFELSNLPSALAFVGAAESVPHAIFLLFGGVVSDRFDKRIVMIVSDALRMAVVTVLAVLTLTGLLELWHLIVGSLIYGVGRGLFVPALGAIVPELVPEEDLVQANSVDYFVSPLAFELVGPGIGGVLVATIGTGAALLLDAVTFGVSLACIWAIRGSHKPDTRTTRWSDVAGDLSEVARYVRGRPWLWATMASGALLMLAFWGPFQTLVPFIVKNERGASAAALGTLFAVGGAGSIVASIVTAQRGLTSRPVTTMYVVWTIGVAGVALFPLTNSMWQMWAINVFRTAAVAVGLIYWTTLIHRNVPRGLQGRVIGTDWFIASSLTPISFLLTGPLADRFGAGPTLFWSSLVAAGFTIAFLFVPGVRDPDRATPPAEPADEPVAV